MDLLGSLGTLATNLKNVTLPGVFAALAFALLLWPPHSYDRIPTVKDNHPDIAQLQLFAREFKDDSKKSLGAYRNHSTAACDVHEGAETYTFLTIPSGFSDRAVVAIKNQLILEDIDRTLFKCVEDEQALQGIEDQLTTNVNALIVTRTSERDGINALYQKYILSLSPMRFEFQEKLEKKESEIADLQAHLLNFQRIQRERARRVLQLNRLESEVKLRLGDAGRLRPVQKFDDILSGLSTHVVGFLTLVFAWGLLVDPVNRAVFSFVYDNGFDEEWDSVRPVRQSPGDDAFKKWVPERQADPARTPEGQTQTEAPAGQTERRKGNWLFAAVAGIRSNAWLSLVVVLLSIIAAVLIVLLYEPGSLPPRTSTIIRPSATSVPSGGSITFIATVVAAGSPYVPCGTVKFSEGEDALGSGPLDKESTVEYSVKLPNGTHRITAKYDPSSKENKVPAECEGSPNFQSSSASVAVSFGSKLPPSRAEVPVVPDLSNQQLPQYVRDFSKCVA